MRYQQNVPELRLQPRQIEGRNRSIRELQRRAGDSRVRDLVEFLRQANLIQNLHDGRMNRVTAKLPVEVAMPQLSSAVTALVSHRL